MDDQEVPEVHAQAGQGFARRRRQPDPSWRPVGNGLPPFAGSFIGREQATQEVLRRLGDAELVTLTGPGGVGKTRLALEIATRLVKNGERAAFVDLAPLPDDTAVLPVLAATLGFHGDPSGGLFDAVAAHVGDNSLLVVLDNCEHVRGGCAQVTEILLGACGGLRFLATSRERLRARQEVVWPVPPLPVPGSGPVTLPDAFVDSDAVRLFCERAAALQPGFLPTPGNIEYIAAICRRLDGLPLAIELAAAQVDVLAPGEIAARLDERFELLRGGRSTAPPRHQTLHGALAWSYDRLSQAERALLRRLSVFPASFDLDGAEQVCAGGDVEPRRVLGLLSGLVAKSLVVADTTGVAARYRLLETVRAYAAERLEEMGRTEALRERHADWCVTTMEKQASPESPTPPLPAAATSQFAPNHDDVRAALEWAIREAKAELALRLARIQMRSWEAWGCFAEARECLEKVLALPGTSPGALRASVLHDAGLAAAMIGDLRTARSRLQASLSLWDDASDLASAARTRSALAFVCTFDAEAPSVEHLENQLAEVRDRVGDAGLAEALAACGQARMFRGDPGPARDRFEQSLEAARRSGYKQMVPTALVGLGSAELTQGDYEQGEAHLREAVSLAADSGDVHTELVGRTWLAELHLLRGQADHARSQSKDCLDRARAMGAPYPLARSLLGLGRALLEGGDAEGARRLFQEATAIARRINLAHLEAAALVAQGQAALALGVVPGARRHLDEALDLARRRQDKVVTAASLYQLGKLSRAEGYPERSGTLHHEALALQEEITDRAGVAESLEALGGVALARGCDETAARLFGAGQALREAGGYIRENSHGASYEGDIALLVERLGGDELDVAWREGAGLSAKQAMSRTLKCRDRRTRPAEGWDSLTPAERGVVALAADGFTNAEIAEHLFISAETVKTHLSNVYPKLGISSRRQLRAIVQDEAR